MPDNVINMRRKQSDELKEVLEKLEDEGLVKVAMVVLPDNDADSGYFLSNFNPGSYEACAVNALAQNINMGAFIFDEEDQ